VRFRQIIINRQSLLRVFLGFGEGVRRRRDFVDIQQRVSVGKPDESERETRVFIARLRKCFDRFFEIFPRAAC
jgi:hypothetical protein